VVRLTDKYPNFSAFEHAQQSSKLLRFERLPVDAERIPEHLRGFRTLFSTLHHFAPDAVRRVLRDAIASGQGVGAFELAQREPRTLLANCLIPGLLMFLTLSIRPFRWSRLLWTYWIPVVPFIVAYDGWSRVCEPIPWPRCRS
jgi:hypothetical protein